MRYMRDIIEDKEMKIMNKVWFYYIYEFHCPLETAKLHIYKLMFDLFVLYINQWAIKSRKSYTVDELDVVRFETLDYIQEIM